LVDGPARSALDEELARQRVIELLAYEFYKLEEAHGSLVR